MIRIVDDYVYYNANSRGKFTGDCVARSLSLAFDKRYNDVIKDLNAYKNMRGLSDYKGISSVRGIIKEYGFDRWNSVSDRVTLKDFAEEHSNGTYLCFVGETKINHIVCIINGDYYDSWDSSDNRVFEYLLVNSEAEDFSMYVTPQYLNDNIDSIVDSLKEPFTLYFNKYMEKEKIKDVVEVGHFGLLSEVKNYEVSFNVDLKMKYKSDSTNMDRTFATFIFRFTPKTKIDDIITACYSQMEKQCKDLTKQLRTKYDNYMEYVGEFGSFNQDEINSINKKAYRWRLATDKRLIDKLPLWSKKLIVDIHQNTKWQMDFHGFKKFKIVMNALPSDSNRKQIIFGKDKMQEVLDALNQYYNAVKNNEEDTRYMFN